MPFGASPICMYCKRLHADNPRQPGWFCDAFPDGIPPHILSSQADHHEPVDGDHGLQFQAKSPEDGARAERIIERANRRKVEQ